MKQRFLVLQAREKALVTNEAAGTRSPKKSLDEKAENFFTLLRDREDMSWEEFAKEFRENYYDSFDEIVAALLATDDPLIIYNCFQLADMSRSNEREALAKFITECDWEKHQVTISELTDFALGKHAYKTDKFANREKIGPATEGEQQILSALERRYHNMPNKEKKETPIDFWFKRGA